MVPGLRQAHAPQGSSPPEPLDPYHSAYGVQCSLYLKGEYDASEKTNNKDEAGFRVLLTPDKAALNAGSATALNVLVRVAPDLPPGTVPRAPLHLALALDRSGSMSGAPLEEAKRCARNIIDHLSPSATAPRSSLSTTRSSRGIPSTSEQARVVGRTLQHQCRRDDQPP